MIYAECKSEIAGDWFFSRGLEWSGDPLSSLKNKKVCVYIHGMKETDAQANRAYLELSSRSTASYDAFVGFKWPSGSLGIEWPLLENLSVLPATQFFMQCLREVLSWETERVDINAHSLGCPIAMEALRLSNYPVNNVWLMAGAMPRNLIDYKDIKARLVHSFYSKKDWALWVSWLSVFRLQPMTPKLGQFGEKTPGGDIGYSYDFTKEVGANHSGYRHSSLAFQTFYNVTSQQDRDRLAELHSRNQMLERR